MAACSAARIAEAEEIHLGSLMVDGAFRIEGRPFILV